jgi:hypothetical protein
MEFSWELEKGVESKKNMHHHFALTIVEATKKNIKKITIYVC